MHIQVLARPCLEYGMVCSCESCNKVTSQHSVLCAAIMQSTSGIRGAILNPGQHFFANVWRSHGLTASIIGSTSSVVGCNSKYVNSQKLLKSYFVQEALMLCNVTRVIHNIQYVLLWLRLLEFLLQQSIYYRIQQSILAASCVTLFCTQTSCGTDINTEM